MFDGTLTYYLITFHGKTWFILYSVPFYDFRTSNSCLLYSAKFLTFQCHKQATFNRFFMCFDKFHSKCTRDKKKHWPSQRWLNPLMLKPEYSEPSGPWLVMPWLRTSPRHHQPCYWVYVDGLAQDCSNSSASALELLQSCTKPSIWSTCPFLPRTRI